jgi:N-methylhydantoinase A
VRLFEAQYALQFGRAIPGLEVEAMSWALRLAARTPSLEPCPPTPSPNAAAPGAQARVADPLGGEFIAVPVHRRAALSPGAVVAGPALIVEDETTTLVTSGFTAEINGLGYIVLTRRSP